MNEILGGFSNKSGGIDTLAGLLVFILIVVTLFLICREIVCWYWKINKMVELMEEADKDRKQILELLMHRNDSVVNNEKESIIK